VGHDSPHQIHPWSLHGHHAPCHHVLGHHSTFLLQQVSGTRWCSQTKNHRKQSQINNLHSLERWMCWYKNGQTKQEQQLVQANKWNYAVKEDLNLKQLTKWLMTLVKYNHV
jgi:hypothetical protein